MQKLYHQAMKLEMEFFLAQPLDQQTVVPLLQGHNRKYHRVMVFSDFDLTCTVVDSCAILAEIAMDTAPKSDQTQQESQNEITRMPLAELKNTWERLSREYMEEYEQCKESILVYQKGEAYTTFIAECFYAFVVVSFGQIVYPNLVKCKSRTR